MEVQHPAAKMMVEVAKTQDDEVVDGTTTSVVYRESCSKRPKSSSTREFTQQFIVDGYRQASSEH